MAIYGRSITAKKARFWTVLKPFKGVPDWQFKAVPEWQKKARFWTDLKANQIALDYIVLGRSGTTQNKPFWTGPKCLFWNNILWAQVNDFRSSRSNFDGSRQALWGLSRKGVQVPFMTPPDSSNVICPCFRVYLTSQKSRYPITSWQIQLFPLTDWPVCFTLKQSTQKC